MEFETIKETILERLKEELDSAEYKVEHVNDLQPTDEGREGFRITRMKTGRSIVVYERAIILRYLWEDNIDNIIEDILDKVDIEAFISDRPLAGITREYLLKNILPKVVNVKDTKRYSGCPFRPLNGLDLVVVYYCKVDTDRGVPLLVGITDIFLNEFVLTEEELYAAAKKNLECLPYKFKHLSEHLMEIQCIDDTVIETNELQELKAVPFYILTNTDCRDGSGYLISDKILSEISDQMGGEYVIFPSSQHELLMLPSDGMDPRMAVQNIKEVNEEHVAPEEWLSDALYAYNKRDGLYVRAAVL